MFRDVTEFDQPLDNWMIENVNDTTGILPLDNWKSYRPFHFHSMFHDAINFEHPHPFIR